MKLHTVGNFVNIPSEKDLSKHIVDNRIIFVGKMSYEPNIVAVTYFVKNIFPKVKVSYPQLEFLIVGANPDERVKNLELEPNVKVTGFVDSIRPYFQNATIIIAPMLTGAGIQNKIIQAMSYGCCVATTPIGAEGLTIDDEIAIYSGTEEWVSGLTKLLGDKTSQIIMGRKAHNYIVNNLSKDVVAKQFWQFIGDVN